MTSKFLVAISSLMNIILYSSAQNLVLNPGLENFITCPGFGQFGNTWITDWHKPSWGSSDYYHFNCAGIVPAAGAFPHSGNAEAGIILYNFGQEYREYITGTLSQPLVAGQNYLVEFYIALNPGYIQAVQEAGAFFSDSIPGFYANSLTINEIPQIKNVGGFLSYGWTKVTGSFIASGGENYLTIGNFNTDSATNTSMVGSSGSYGAYYFIDDVYVGAADSIPPSAIPAINHKKPPLFPNPVKSEQQVPLLFTVTERSELILFDSQGNCCQVVNIQPQDQSLTFSALSSGLYFYRFIVSGKLISSGKLFIE